MLDLQNIYVIFMKKFLRKDKGKKKRNQFWGHYLKRVNIKKKH